MASKTIVFNFEGGYELKLIGVDTDDLSSPDRRARGHGRAAEGARDIRRQAPNPAA